jgi:hypothetical protein
VPVATRHGRDGPTDHFVVVDDEQAQLPIVVLVHRRGAPRFRVHSTRNAIANLNRTSIDISIRE